MVPEFHRPIVLHAKREELVRSIDVNRVHASNRLVPVSLQHQGIEKSSLVKVKSVNFVACGSDESVAGWEMVGYCAAEAWYSSSIVKAALRVQFH
jgi:hypothetical protein